MNNPKFFKLIFFLVFISFTCLVILNYTVKTPNDGVLYYTAALFLTENGSLIDTTRTIGEIIMPFPTSQFGIVLFLSILIYLFKSFWIFFYVIFLSIIWTILIKRLCKFSFKNFSDSKYLSLIFPFLIFFNYDYLISSSSFYNEALYYPFLIFSFLKIINTIEKERSFFYKNYLFSIFLALGIVFRIQHLVLLAALGIYFLIYKKFKEFFYILILSGINIALFVLSINYIQNAQYGNELTIVIENNNKFDLVLYIKTFFLEFYKSLFTFDNNLLLKNLKVHLTAYLHFLNIPKIVDITLPNYGKSKTEFVYIIFSFIVVFILFKYFKKKKLDKINLFLIIYFLISSIFLIFLPDAISRYFLFTNFCIIYFLNDYFKFYKLRQNHIKFFAVGFFIFITINFIYAYSYFQNYSLSYKWGKAFRTINILKEYKSNRKGLLPENEIYISRYNYQIKWVLNKPSVSMNHFLVKHQKYQSKNKYFFIGTKNEFNNGKLSLITPEVETLENYLFNKVNNDEISIWKIHLEEK